MLRLIFSLNTLWWMILFLYIPACFGLIIIVLLQKGKGQGLAGAFGMGGGMDTIFGPRSSKSLPQKITYASAAVFMTLALVMSMLSGKVGRPPAPELVAETTEASLEALFDPAPPASPVSITIDEDADTEAPDAASLFEMPLVEVDTAEMPLAAEDEAVSTTTEEPSVSYEEEADEAPETAE